METNNELSQVTDWTKILDLIESNKFSESYPGYDVIIKEKGYLIHKKGKEGKDINIYLFNQKKNIKIHYDNNLSEILEINSSLEIENNVKKNGKDIEKLYTKDTNFRYSQIFTMLGCYIDEEFEIKEKKKLDELKFVRNLNDDEDYTPEEYSKFFHYYFVYDNEAENNKKIVYQNSNIRKIIFKNICSLNITNIKSFKFTGPHSVGKSFTLLRISRILLNVAYINLKVLYKYKNDLYLSYNIIIHELERFNIRDNMKNLEDLIIKNYNENISYLKLLLNVMEFLNKLTINFIFIFDQFKLRYIETGFIEKIKTFINIKIVQCSSINDKNIREECIKTWSLKGKNITILHEDIQDYYLYYSNLYKIDRNNYESNNEILRQFAYMPKYVNKYKTKVIRDKSFLNKEKENILSKITDYCDSEIIEQSYLLTALKNIVGKEFSNDLFSSVIKYCPLKYFIIDFKEYSFKVKPIFPFLMNIVNYEIKENECDDFFKNEKYKNNSIFSDIVKGDYFEASAKLALMKFKLPDNTNSRKVTLYEIVSMDKIIKPDDYILEEEYEKENEKENNTVLIDNTTVTSEIKNISNVISEIKLDKEVNNENNKDNKDKDDSEEEEEKEDNPNAQDEDINMYDENEDEEEKIENIEKVKPNLEIRNDYLNMLLDKFDVDIKEKELNSQGLSLEAITYSKNIEDYRFDEINNQINEEEIIVKNDDFTGDESIFLDQFNKRGKTLDFAYLYGTKNNKTFIGFQMKCYFINSNLNNDTVDKCKIRRDCQKILINSMKLFNCKITKWYYYLVFYYNSKVPNENINQENLSKCERNNIGYFFYEPIEKQFYCVCKGKKKEINELIIDQNADLDAFVINAINFSQKVFEELKFEVGQEIGEMKESFINDFKEVFKFKKKPSISSIFYRIQKALNLKKLVVLFHTKCKFSNNYFFPPDKDYIFLYKRKDSDSFIASFIKNKLNKFIDLSSGKTLKTIFDVLDVNYKYYYCLKKYKFSESKKIQVKIERVNFNAKIPNFSSYIYKK